MVCGGVLNIILNYYLIPLYGAMGAVIATIGSSWFSVHGVCFIISPLNKTGKMMTKALFYPKCF
jgi:O-antigen/teichoic acid export membrane protein